MWVSTSFQLNLASWHLSNRCKQSLGAFLVCLIGLKGGGQWNLGLYARLKAQNVQQMISLKLKRGLLTGAEEEVTSLRTEVKVIQQREYCVSAVLKALLLPCKVL